MVEESFICFRGWWSRQHKRTVEAAILEMEAELGHPEDSAAELWVVVSEPAGHGLYVYMAHRLGWEEPFTALSPRELVADIRRAVL